MKFEAILHIPQSNYAHGIDKSTIIFRLRAARGDLKACTLFYADRCSKVTPVIFFEARMEVVAQDTLFDYFEVTLKSPFTRVFYYFLLNDGNIKKIYYSDMFKDKHTNERSEYYQLPFNRPEDIATIPEWTKDAVVYNIFPDSFATSYRHISRNETKAYFNSIATYGKNGGTIKGITENLDYISDLGINCIYLNPIFAASEWHKYDTIDYFSIDPCFGTNNDLKDLVDECHKKNIKIILDGVFNHCGWKFFAFVDVVENGEKSKYKDWFYNINFPVIIPDNDDDIPNYDCFAYERKMPKMNTSNPEVIEYFCKVCTFWIEKFNIDGWRLDVANEINHDFWREFKKAARKANPDCFIIGEAWENAYEWLKGDQFDSCMNYDFRKNCRDFIANNTIDAFEFDSRVTNMRMRYNKNMIFGQLNLLDSHDVSRYLTLCKSNVNKFKLSVVFLMTAIGIPCIFYGDEQAISGLSESEYRQPMIWNENTSLYNFYKDIIGIRKSSDAFSKGDYLTISANKNTGVYIFKRFYENQSAIVILNASSKKEMLDLSIACHTECVISEGIINNSIAPWGFAIFLEHIE